MKYINNRHEFLNKSKEKIDLYNNLESTTASKLVSRKDDLLLEASGPFENDIPWGDSLLGRLINSAIRKAKIAANLMVMKNVINRLKRAFDDMLIESKAATLDEEDKKKLSKIMITSYLYNLEKAVTNMHVEKTKLEEIKNLTNIAIEKVEEEKDLEDKNELIRQLQEWKKFLDSIKEEDNVEEDEKEPEKKSEKISAEKLYSLRLENFKSALRLVNLYIKDQQKRASAVTPHLAGNKGFRTGILTPQEKAELEKTKGTATGATITSTTATAKTTENFSYINLNEEVAPPKPTTPNSPIISLLKKLHGTVVQIIPPKEKGGEIVEIVDFLKFSPAQQKGQKFVDSITKVYNVVEKICKKGDVASSESIDNLLARPDELGKKIGELYLVSKSKDDGKFEGISPEMQKEIEVFNKTMKSCLYSELVFKKEEVKERFISNYSNFKKFYEAEEGVENKGENKEDKSTGEEKVGDKPKSGFVNKIQGWWNSNMNIAKWMMKVEEVDKARVELDKKLAEKKDSVDIPSIDPVLEICKIFNRAYQIHTTQVIPSGRSGGRVSNKTFMEYHCFGNGSPANAGEGGGPYRNTRLFQNWYEAVNDIMGDKKYQPIFNTGTRIKVGNEYIDRAGSNLRKFMSEMLDGEEMYKAGGKGEQGAQAKFLDKYFGYKDPKDLDSSKGRYYDPDSDKQEISATAKSIKTSAAGFVKQSIPIKSSGELKHTFFIIADDSNMNVYFVEDVKDNLLHIQTSGSLKTFRDKMRTQGITVKETEDVPLNTLENGWSKSGKSINLYGFKVNWTDFFNEKGELKPAKLARITAISQDSPSTPTEINIDEYRPETWKELFTLADMDSMTPGKTPKRVKVKNSNGEFNYFAESTGKVAMAKVKVAKDRDGKEINNPFDKTGVVR